MELKIYFAGSIRGGRDDKEQYLKLITYLKTHGKVLTEHVADPSLTPKGEENLTDIQIYNRDIDWIKESDIIIAETTAPSLGVGYELAYAEKLNKPILCLYKIKPNKRLSAMLSGNQYFKIINYNQIDEAKEHIKDFIKTFNNILI